MNASYNWLRALVPFDLSPEELREVITAHTATVDELVPLREDLKDVVVGRVVEAAPHPNSDHLWVTKVDAGTGELLDVVCGAPNVRAGHTYPFAPTGSTLPGGLKLEKRKIRGAISNGMLCSARELGLGEDHSGILELDTDAAPGTPFLEAMPVGDTRLVIDVTPNRPDLLSHLGLAREIAAVTEEDFALPAISGGETVAVPEPAWGERSARANGVPVELVDAEGCPRYMGVVIRGVRIGPSPNWIVERLLAVGSRPINNIVDATNYLLHELGQPMHAFDLSKLAGPAVSIRRAARGETITTLDGVVRTLDPAMTVIADAKRAQAVAGVMGGQESEVTEQTTDIFLEVAAFTPANVRRTRRQLGLSTDASYRFERGIDVHALSQALERAVRLIIAVAGGTVDGTPVDLGRRPLDRTVVPLRIERVTQLLGELIPMVEVTRLLESVGFSVQAAAGDLLVVTAPGWRPDVHIEADLIEEVARLKGYDFFPDELRPFRAGSVPDSPDALLARRVREALVGEGLLETRPMPFVAGSEDGYVRVANPLAENEAYLRRSLLETLARRAEYNFSHMQRDVRLFEVGAVFAPADGALPREELHAAALITGHRRPPHWTEPTPPDVDAWDAKGLGETLAHAAFPTAKVETRPACGDVLWDIVIDGEARGAVRQLSVDSPIWAAPVFGIELRLDVVVSAVIAAPGTARYVSSAERSAEAGHHLRYRPLPVTPSAEFDLALLVPVDMPAERVENVMRQGGGELLERLVLFDEYRGEHVPEGFRSLAWRLTFRHPERTLRDKEIAGRREKLLRTLEGELGVRQRTS
ncbi:MAG TPA: phenylalanine--tRNA ligase subunit beta [Gemmatimonadaceae bacterium]|nr:phenylalanine--tRNA ligase subunit beta [Gemmatimonadaceae bacterium]